MADTKSKNATPNQKEKQQAAQQAIDQIRERFGEGSIMKLGDAKSMNVECIPTGCLSLDMALGIGGVPRGRIVEIYGPEASGKTTLSQHVVAEVQKIGGTAAFVDAEHALDPEYAKKIGVNVDELLISQPDNGEQALEIVDTLVRSNAVDVIVIDSVAALTPKSELEGEMGDRQMGTQARLMSQALRKLTGAISKSNCTVIFINQIRMKIGVFFGNPETTTGGNALKFYSSVRIEVRRSAQIKQGDQIIGNRVKVKIVKNKVAPPFQRTEFDIMYNQGIAIQADILEVGAGMGIIQKRGNSFSYGDEKLGLGRQNAAAYLRDKPELMAEIRDLAWAKFKGGDTELSSDEKEESED